MHNQSLYIYKSCSELFLCNIILYLDWFWAGWGVEFKQAPKPENWRIKAKISS